MATAFAYLLKKMSSIWLEVLFRQDSRVKKENKHEAMWISSMSSERSKKTWPKWRIIMKPCGFRRSQVRDLKQISKRDDVYYTWLAALLNDFVHSNIISHQYISIGTADTMKRIER